MKANAAYVIGGSIGAFLVLVPLTISAEEMMCTMQYQPVCGARTVQCIKAPCYPIYETFGNRCVLDSADAIYIHDGECTAKEVGPYNPNATTSGSVIPKIKTTNEVKISIDGVALTSLNVDLSNTDTDRSAPFAEKANEPKLVSLWKGLWTRMSEWLRM